MVLLYRFEKLGSAIETFLSQTGAQIRRKNSKPTIGSLLVANPNGEAKEITLKKEKSPSFTFLGEREYRRLTFIFVFFVITYLGNLSMSTRLHLGYCFEIMEIQNRF